MASAVVPFTKGGDGEGRVEEMMETRGMKGGVNSECNHELGPSSEGDESGGESDERKNRLMPMRQGNEEELPVLRSRHKSPPLFPCPPMSKRGGGDARWKVPRGGDDEQLTRLKSACHYASISFFSASLNNNKVNKTSVKRTTPATTTHSPPATSKSEVTNGFSPAVEETWRSGRNILVTNVVRPVVALVTIALKGLLLSAFLLVVLYCLMVLHKPTQAFVTRHTQDLIYPFMRTIRFGSLPFLSTLPQLHELYEDACLLANPFFEMNDVSCWPCESVRHVIDLTGFSNFTTGGYYHNGIPFTVSDSFVSDVSIEDIYKLAQEDHHLATSVLLKTSAAGMDTLGDLIHHDVRPGNFFSGNLHVTWKINRAQWTRMMRKAFSKPYFIPNTTEISIQHFLFVDEPRAEQYALPVTEFANVFVMQADGRRLIVLVPVKHCRTTCKAISVVLQPKHVLFYNWLFWRPISFPLKAVRGDPLSITYVGSFY